jgi:hypothetical protein
MDASGSTPATPRQRSFFRANPIVSRVEPQQRIEALIEHARIMTDVLFVEGYTFNGIKQNVDTQTPIVENLSSQ